MTSKLTEPGLGFLTVCRDMGIDLEAGLGAIENNMRFAKANGYKALEVAAFPAMMPGDTTKRDFYGETINLDWALANREIAREGTTRLEEETGVVLEALCYCANTLGNQADRSHVDKMITAAIEMGVPNVVAFIGNCYDEFTPDMSGEARENYFRNKLFERIDPLVKRANDNGVEVAIENCSMRGALGYSGQSLTSNWFSNPAEWDIVIETIPGIKMWFDPSHLRNYRSQNCGDPTAEEIITSAIQQYGKHFAGVHLKDGEDDEVGMERFYSSGNVFGDNTHTGDLWIARAPGRGSINWGAFEAQVRIYAPKAMIRSVEMEDLDVAGRAANESALKEVQGFYKEILKN